MKKLALFIVLLLTSLSFAAATPPAEYDRWYSLLMQNQPAGWCHNIIRKDADNVVSTSSTAISLRRGAMTVKIAMEQSFTETLDGKPLEAKTRQTLGTMLVVQSYRFTPTGVELTTEQAGQTTKSTLPLLQGEWLTPAAAERYAQSQYRAGAKEFHLRTISIEQGLQLMDVSVTVTGQQNIAVLGKTVPAIVTRQTTSLMPGTVATVYVDDQGRELKTELDLMPGMKLTMLASDKDLASAKVSPPELLNVMLLKPDKPIHSPRTLRKAVYELDLKLEPDAKPPELPVGGAQSVARPGPSSKSIRVTIDADAPAPPDRAPTDDDRKSCAMIDRDDPKVRELTKKALAGKDNLTLPQKAETLRQFVHGFIQQKDLSVGFASASEVARTAEGDCTEHAVLLAALLRAADIPSRTVSGLIYADQFAGHEGIFGYHMWTQAWLIDKSHPTGHWLDLDATLAQTPFDATHIALSTSNLSDATQGNDMVHLSQLLGRVSIRVIEPK